MKFVSLLIFLTIASQVLSVLFRDSVGVAKKHREKDVKCHKVPINKCAEQKNCKLVGKRCRTKKPPSKKFFQTDDILLSRTNILPSCYSFNNEEMNCTVKRPRREHMGENTKKSLRELCIWNPKTSKCCLKSDFIAKADKCMKA